MLVRRLPTQYSIVKVLLIVSLFVIATFSRQFATTFPPYFHTNRHFEDQYLHLLDVELHREYSNLTAGGNEALLIFLSENTAKIKDIITALHQLGIGSRQDYTFAISHGETLEFIE
ncbi:hypothetical protein ACFLUU_10520 [Chloroflexota bacterium]